MINRLIEPTSGLIEIQGEDITGLPATQVRRGLGYVIQQVGLFPHRAIEANTVTVPCTLGWDKARIRTRVEELVEVVGIEQSLPLRTHLAFAGIVVLGTAWMAMAAYVLTRRRPLYAADRVLATGMAVAATSTVGIATTVLAGLRGGVLPGLTAGAMSTTFVAARVALHLGARRRRHVLLARHRDLTRST